MTIFLYSRVSHKTSASSGISLDEQAAQGVAYARSIIPEDALSSQSFGSSEPGIFADKAVSGWNRPFLSRAAGNAIAQLVKPGDHIVCYSIDRLARNVKDFAITTDHFMKMGVNVHYITEGINTSTANGKLQANIRAAVAQWHSDMASERVREAQLIKRLGFCSGAKHEKVVWTSSSYDFSRLNQSKARPFGKTYRYERASDISQYTSGLGLEQQARANESYAKAWCERTGSVDGGVFREDAVSAFGVPFRKRPQGSILLSTVQPGDDIVVYRADRAWRSTRDALEMLEGLTERGIYVHIVRDGIRTDSDGGLDWLAIMSAVAQLESSLKRKRKLETNEWLRKNGRPAGKAPAGWKKITLKDGVKRLKLDMEQCARIVAIWVLRHDEKISIGRLTNVEHAWRCADKGKPMTLKDPVHGKAIESILARAERIRAVVGPVCWEKILDNAWELIRTPIEDKYWNKHIIRWNYNETLGIETPVESR